MAADDQDEAPPDDEESDEEEGSESEGKKKRLSGKALVLRYVLPALLVFGGAGGAIVSGALDSVLGGGEKVVEGAEVEEEPQDVVYYELPEMLVNLNGSGRRTHYLKLSVSLELTDPNDIPRLEMVLPRIIDNFQVYLRELRVEDLQGSAGLYRLREELLTRVTLAAAPAKIHDVLFKEMLIQ